MSPVSSFKRLLGALKRLFPRRDRTRTTRYALASNQTALRNLTRTIEKRRHPGQDKSSVVQQCLAESLGYPPTQEASTALQIALEKLQAASTEDPAEPRLIRRVLRRLRSFGRKRRGDPDRGTG